MVEDAKVIGVALVIDLCAWGQALVVEDVELQIVSLEINRHLISTGNLLISWMTLIWTGLGLPNREVC